MLRPGHPQPYVLFVRPHDPHMAVIGCQVLGSLLLIVWGSYIFVEKVQILSTQMGISPFILAIVMIKISLLYFM